MRFIGYGSRFVRRGMTVALLLPLLMGAKGGCGSKENNEKLASPVQAVATLLEGADKTVSVELVLISTATAPNQFITTATNARLRVPPSGVEVPLVQSTAGHYTASSLTAPALVYLGGQTYQFKFDLVDEVLAKQVSGGNFVAVLTVPDDAVTATLSKAPAFAGDLAELSWTPAARSGIINVTNASGQTTYSTFDFSTPDFDGAKWARLQAGGSFQLAVDVFPVAGTYTARVCVVSKVSDFDKSLSVDLGVLSGFLAGRCPADLSIMVGS
ncbi:MAG: hypothetical protein JXP73_21460 [Deltaproteobacteria bacterium]|nr:hypothetical protein [Deltaproteobacteria bacterium]